MRKTRRRGGPPTRTPDWQKWTTAIPAATLVALKVRAVQEGRPMCEVLVAAIGVYLATAVRA